MRSLISLGLFVRRSPPVGAHQAGLPHHRPHPIALRKGPVDGRERRKNALRRMNYDLLSAPIGDNELMA